MKDYKLGIFSGVVRISDGAEIPEKEGNRDWKEYQLWLAEGNTPDPAMSLDELKTDRKVELSAEADDLIDAQTGDTNRKRMMMVAKGLAMLDEQSGRGNARNPQQDVLRNIFSYVELVGANLETALLAVDASSDPSTITLEHPPLPGI